MSGLTMEGPMPGAAPLPALYTVPEAAEILRISQAKMRQLVHDKEIQHIKIGEMILISGDFIRFFIEKQLKKCYNLKVMVGNSVPIIPEHPYLDNSIEIEPDRMPLSEGDFEMATKINQSVMINGEKHWITAKSAQDFANKVVSRMGIPQASGKHPFTDYAWNWFNTYSKPNVETVTATTYKRQLTLHLIPAFDGLAVEDITTDDVQRLFNGMTGAKATKDKAKMVLNQILDAAVEDGLLTQNPLKSKRVKVKGKSSKATEPYTVEQMRYLIKHIGDIKNPVDRAYLALQALHPLRLEEALGLQADDVDAKNMEIHVRRAVTHPTRNQPEIKATKTDSSRRTIGLSSLALPHLLDVEPGKFLFGGDKPLSYTQVRRMCDRIKRETGFEENITPIRFRTTVLTDLYDQTKDIKLAQAAAGHTTPAMTLKHYVKGRETSARATAAVERIYTQ